MQGEPLRDDQVKGLLEILIETDDKIGGVNDSAEMTPIDRFEQHLENIDEYERLVIEMAPSVLSIKQVEIMFRQYQERSYQRAQVLENHKKAIAAGEKNVPLWYPPRFN